MKTTKAICTAAVLALLLTVPAYAGDIDTPGITSAAGEIGCPGKEILGDIDTPGIAGDVITPGFMDIIWTVFSLI
jgi:hypothetical protein